MEPTEKHDHEEKKVKNEKTNIRKRNIKKSSKKNITAQTLKRLIPQIVEIWCERCILEIESAIGFKSLALKNSIPKYLENLVKDLSNTIKRTKQKDTTEDNIRTSIGKEHGLDRALNSEYTIDQLILEYHILRQVLFGELAKEIVVTEAEREVILGSIEQAVSDAVTQYNNTIKEFQQKFTHTLAHDLRTPLAIARLSAQLILKKPAELSSTIDKANKICDSIDRVDKMISEILDLGKAQSSQELELEDCDLITLTQDVSNELNMIYGGKLQVKHSIKECLGHWNAPGLRRVIENLVNNAFKHGQEASPVVISITQTPDSAKLCIHNEGNPITKEDRKNLFGEFKRGKNSGQKKGWGIGLTTVKAIIDKHEGQISIKSKEGYGTDFIIRIPKKIKD